MRSGHTSSSSGSSRPRSRGGWLIFSVACAARMTPGRTRGLRSSLGDQLENLAEEIGRIERLLMAWHRLSAASQWLETIWTCYGLMPLL